MDRLPQTLEYISKMHLFTKSLLKEPEVSLQGENLVVGQRLNSFKWVKFGRLLGESIGQ